MTNKKIIAECKLHAKENNVSILRVYLDLIYSRFKYGFSLEDYFLNTEGVRMSSISKRDYYSGHKLLSVMNTYNDKKYSYICDNKVDFLKWFNEFIKHKWCYPKEISFDKFKSFVDNTHRIIAKPIKDTWGGKGVHVYIPSDNLKSEYEYYKTHDYLLEEFISQHSGMIFNNESVNTIRIYTVVDSSGLPHVLKAILRVGVGKSTTDNYCAGGVIYPINIKGGFVEGYGVRNIDNKRIYVHPETDIMMLGYKIPLWKDVLDTVIQAAKTIPQLRYLGWDIAILPNGIDLIEANTNAENSLFVRVGDERLFYPQIMKLLKGSKS